MQQFLAELKDLIYRVVVHFRKIEEFWWTFLICFLPFGNFYFGLLFARSYVGSIIFQEIKWAFVKHFPILGLFGTPFIFASISFQLRKWVFFWQTSSALPMLIHINILGLIKWLFLLGFELLVQLLLIPLRKQFYLVHELDQILILGLCLHDLPFNQLYHVVPSF